MIQFKFLNVCFCYDKIITNSQKSTRELSNHTGKGSLSIVHQKRGSEVETYRIKKTNS